MPLWESVLDVTKHTVTQSRNRATRPHIDLTIVIIGKVDVPA